MKNLSSDLTLALDPLAFASLCGHDDLDDWQQTVLTGGARRSLLNCSRQSGKSTVVALLALHEAGFVPDSLILVLSPSLRQSSELFRKILAYYRAASKVLPECDGESTLKMELKNGSRIVSLPGSGETIRGFSAASTVIVDEAARVSDPLYAAIRPVLAVSNGNLIALSTPAGKRGWFYEAWQNGGSTWVRHEVPATDCPRIDDEFLEEERHSLGDFQFRQEYMCEFLDDESSVFASELIQACVSSEVLPLWPTLSQKTA